MPLHSIPECAGDAGTQRRPLDAAWICTRYEAVRHRLPQGKFPDAPRSADGLLAIAEQFDALLLDAFGVLNVGAEPIPGAPEVVAELQRAGKAILVLTNGATQSAANALAKYRTWGYAFEPRDVIASRDLLHSALKDWPVHLRWGFAAPEVAALHELPVRHISLELDPNSYDAADAFVFLSTRAWSYEHQALLHEALVQRPRPLLVANPDIAAPREAGFSLEPGHFAHLLADLPGVDARFYGKPFSNAFEEAFNRLHERGLRITERKRVAMVGDSLHTDILGGAAAGCTTVLITGHGLFRDSDCLGPISDSQITPDFILPDV
jgi:glycerol-1-phosphatase